MTTHTTATVASALRDLADVLDAMSTPAPAKKAPAKKAVAVKVTPAKPAKKGESTREVLSRKEWNRTLTAKARLAGSNKGVSAYSLVLARWADVQVAAKAGATPDEVLTSILFA